MTSPLYVANGQQVLRDGMHFADTHDPAHALALARVLNGQVLLGPEVTPEEADETARALWG